MPGLRYQFLIANTDRSDKSGTHQCSILKILTSNELFLFDLFGIAGLKISSSRTIEKYSTRC